MKTPFHAAQLREKWVAAIAFAVCASEFVKSYIRENVLLTYMKRSTQAGFSIILNMPL